MQSAAYSSSSVEENRIQYNGNPNGMDSTDALTFRASLAVRFALRVNTKGLPSYVVVDIAPASAALFDVSASLKLAPGSVPLSRYGFSSSEILGKLSSVRQLLNQ